MKQESPLHMELKGIRSVGSIKRLAKLCTEDKEVFEEIILFCKSKDKHISNMSTWIASHAVEKSPTILKDKHYNILLEVLAETPFSPVRRNILRLFQFTDRNHKNISELAVLALDFFSDKKQDVAVRAFAITVLQNCLLSVPEIKDEVMFIIEKEMPYSSPAYRFRAGKFIKAASE